MRRICQDSTTKAQGFTKDCGKQKLGLNRAPSDDRQVNQLGKLQWVVRIAADPRGFMPRVKKSGRLSGGRRMLTAKLLHSPDELAGVVFCGGGGACLFGFTGRPLDKITGLQNAILRREAGGAHILRD